ncbi:hypothetical protein [Pengzhenrongella frigida]|uniref:YCII-related domain-containing protein n=1 Tax=Pengzhenrongella frigida TaxID=1259133 RepID=A0A4Q5N2R1_9MICO|nr:hypothetical protein [Cellulomonas sp. HLT2-17]RYV51533.1 hypothetical protein EUA98_08080 [Cellulomonas sp. HLT2-17]
MPAYLARITVSPVPDDGERFGMADALGADADHEMSDGGVIFHVLGEAPDLSAATAAGRQHAAEVLDGYTFEVEVHELP